MNNSTTLSTVCNKNPQNFALHLRGAHDLFPQVHYLLFIFFTKNLLINSLETSESQMIAAGLHYSAVLYKDAVWACCTPLIVLCFSTGTIRLLHSCFSCRETVTGSKWVLTDSTNLSDNTFFKIISIFLIFNELKHAYNMDDIVLSSEMELTWYINSLLNEHHQLKDSVTIDYSMKHTVLSSKSSFKVLLGLCLKHHLTSTNI